MVHNINLIIYLLNYIYTLYIILFAKFETSLSFLLISFFLPPYFNFLKNGPVQIRTEDFGFKAQ